MAPPALDSQLLPSKIMLFNSHKLDIKSRCLLLESNMLQSEWISREPYIGCNKLLGLSCKVTHDDSREASRVGFEG